MAKGKMLAKGTGMVSMLNVCYNNNLTEENSILEVSVKDSSWEIFEKV